MSNPGLALVVGGSAGIGLALANEFASHGHDLLLVARGSDGLQAAALTIAKDHERQVDILALDATTDDAPAQIAEAVGNCRAALQYVVLGVGAWHDGSIARTQTATLKRLLDVNVVAPYALQRALLPMIEPGGGILFIGSLAGCLPLPGVSAYAAAKACLHSNVMALRDEMSNTPLKVSLLAPGAVRTDFLPRSSKAWLDWLTRFLASSPQTVAHAGYCGLMSNVRVIVPGIQWRLVWLAVRALPMGILSFASAKFASVLASNKLDESP